MSMSALISDFKWNNFRKWITFTMTIQLLKADTLQDNVNPHLSLNNDLAFMIRFYCTVSSELFSYTKSKVLKLYYLKQNHGENSGNIGYGAIIFPWISRHNPSWHMLGLAPMYQDSQTQINAEIAFVFRSALITVLSVSCKKKKKVHYQKIE